MGNTVRRFFVVVAAADRASFRCGLWPDARVNDKKFPRSVFPIGPLRGIFLPYGRTPLVYCFLISVISATDAGLSSSV